MGQQTLNELRAGAPLVVGGITIVPLERWRVTVARGGRNIHANGSKHAAGIVIVDAHGARALDESGLPLDLDDLRQRTIGLREVLLDW